MQDLITKSLGRSDYQTTLAAMQAFTASRTAETADEIWLTEHNSVYTLGLNRKNVRLPAQHKLKPNIPLVLVDRGGKITYHGVGQVVIYLLIDLKRRNLTVRQLVSKIESSIVDLLAQFGVQSVAKSDAPGVYVNGAKIASVGLRLKNNCCYHGLSLNVDMDLAPFTKIDPCGYAGLNVTQTKDCGINKTPQQMGDLLMANLKANLK